MVCIVCCCKIHYSLQISLETMFKWPMNVVLFSLKGAHFGSPAQTSRSRSPPCQATRRIRRTPQSHPWKPSSPRSLPWPSTFQITLPTWWVLFPLPQGQSGTSSPPYSYSAPISVEENPGILYAFDHFQEQVIGKYSSTVKYSKALLVEL